jgi:hypothetical protein
VNLYEKSGSILLLPLNFFVRDFGAGKEALRGSSTLHHATEKNARGGALGGF